MSQSIPSGLPVLARGRHQDPHEGSCVMEYVSVLAGEPYSDRPRCTPPALTWLAQRVNDGLSDPARMELVLRAPLLARRTAVDPTALVLDALIREAAASGLDGYWFDRGRRRLDRGAASWWRPGARMCLLEVYVAFDRYLVERDDGERDRHLLAVLDAVLDALHPVAAPVVRREAA